MKIFLSLWLLLPCFIFTQEKPDFQKISNEAALRFSYTPDKPLIIVNTTLQKLYFMQGGSVQKEYTVSTGQGGESSQMGSKATPLGWHSIFMKVGEGQPLGRWIYYKVVTDKIIPIYTDKTRVDGDYLITRVMALTGLEEGVNKGGPDGVLDSFKRGINIHGTPEEGLLGTKASHGCVRMRNTEVVELYSLTPSNTLVYITR